MPRVRDEKVPENHPAPLHNPWIGFPLGRVAI